MITPPKKKRGFAIMDPEAHRAIAKMGGLAAHKSGNAHEWNTEEAQEAGRRGGISKHRNKNA